MEEEHYRLDGLTIKEHLLQLAERGNKKFTESLNPGVEHVLGIRVPDLRKLAARIAKGDWEAYLDAADTYYMEERMLQGMVLGCIRPDAVVGVRHVQVRRREEVRRGEQRPPLGIPENMDARRRRVRNPFRCSDVDAAFHR